MRIRWLGWAGVEVEENGERVVIDPLGDTAAVFAWLGERAAGMSVPAVVSPRPGAVAGLITHLHRDHADAAALAVALSADATVYEPAAEAPPSGAADHPTKAPPSGAADHPTMYVGNTGEQLGIAQADHELTAAGITRRPAAPWASSAAGPFTLTALPAVDGTGDPQVSWLIEAGGTRVLHLGDTMFHGWWWRIRERFGAPDVVLAPINGARLTFPHRRPPSPLPGVMDPEQAALAAELLRAERLVPIHYGGYELTGLYEAVPDALERVKSASGRVTALDPGQTIDL
jgi:L-ascorbate metabolism protein UlaG (beta-lactamase superfamily)